jgi:hypothetical protein
MKNNKNLRLAAASLVVFTLLIASRAMAQTVAGSVTSLTGDVRIQRAGTTVAATPGTAVDVSDRLITGPNSRVTVTLTDNSRIELDESTSLVIDQQMATTASRDTKLSLFTGLVRSFVSYTSAPTPNFAVHTPNAVASARGTEYDTSTTTQVPGSFSQEDKEKYKDCRRFTRVAVFDGTVEVINSTNPGGGSVQVPAGHKTWVACGFAPFPPSELGVVAATGLAEGSDWGLFIGGTIVVGGVFGGLAAAGAFGGGNNNHHKHPNTSGE